MDKPKKPNLKLQQQRVLRGWSQRKVAKEIGTNENMVSRWECGESMPSPHYREKLCALFGVDTHALGFIGEKSHALTESRQPGKHLAGSSTSLSSPSTTELNILQASHRALVRYLLQQQTSLLNALAPGSTNLRVGDIVGTHGLFITPPWAMVQGTTTSTSLIDFLVDALTQGQRILLLGDAGQGKTTVLKHVFTLMAQRFLTGSDPTAPLPFYIPLRDIPSLSGNAAESLWDYVCDEFPLPFEDFATLMRNNQIVALFDGFDEIKGELTQQSLNERAASRVFARPSILSCRKSFFEFYLSMSALKERYSQWVELQPLAFTHTVTQYITAFCRQKQRDATQGNTARPEKIIEFIRRSHELQDLAQRPLLLIMMLDIFADPKEMNENTWNVTKLYGKYTEKWLKNEAAKPDSVLRWNEKSMLVQEVAWYTYGATSVSSTPYRLSQSETFTLNDLASIVKTIAPHYAVTAQQLLDDLCFRTLLAVSEGEQYYFLHKSFHEYYVARYIYNRLHNREQHADTVVAIGSVLQEVLPFEVVSFLKEMLDSKEVSPNEKSLLVTNLISVYRSNGGNDLRSATIRQQASHYLARLGTPRAIQFLEQQYEQEPNKWVQRGMMVGLALYCDKAGVLEQYIKLLREDPEAASINIGYHLVYYGDQAQELGYDDQGGERCDGTVRALFRRLSSERYKNGWALDILTLSTLLEQRGRELLASHAQQLPLLREFLTRDHQKLGETFRQEKEHLEKILQGAPLWR